MTRPISWSSLDLWTRDKNAWIDRYVKGIKDEPTPAMIFGKSEGERLANDRTYMPEIARPGIPEFKVETTLGDIPLIGYFDFWEPNTLTEIKTGKKWDQNRVNKHGQLSFYAMLLYLKEKLKPEDIAMRLVWLATRDEGGVCYVRDMKPVTFSTKRTLMDIMVICRRIQDAYPEMRELTKNTEAR